MTLEPLKLGEATLITMSTKNLEQSRSFYDKLGYTKVIENAPTDNQLKLTDQTLVIQLKEEENSYLGLTYFTEFLDEKVAAIESRDIEIDEKIEKAGQLSEIFLSSPNGLRISLNNADLKNIYQPQGLTLLNFPEEDFLNPEKYPNPKCGVFGEFSQSVTDLEKSIGFWEKLGFNALSVNQEPYPWAIMSDQLNILGLHQTEDFTQSAITYFASDMKNRISQLKAVGITSIKPFTIDDDANAIVTAPEGMQIFLFSF